MSNVPRSANLLVNILLEDPSILKKNEKEREKKLRALAKIATEHYPTPALVGDSDIYKVVVWALGIVAVSAVIGTIVLVIVSGMKSMIQIPETITALGSAAIGALAGLLVPRQTAQSSPQAVSVTTSNSEGKKNLNNAK
ncbi:MAG: hypothetical protein PVI44_09640 [Balneolaceae bacterium]|jgi:hypothetical protein